MGQKNGKEANKVIEVWQVLEFYGYYGAMFVLRLLVIAHFTEERGEK